MSPAPAPGRATAGPATLAGSGLLVVDKPAGPTSHDVVLRVRRALGAPGAGHLGTLDPPATGLLVVAVGAATRCAPLLGSGDKTYDVTIRFGVTTDTDDLAGAVIASSGRSCTETEIRAAATEVARRPWQIPPRVSAVHVGGERMHRLARAGAEFTAAARPVRVDSWEWLEFAWPDARARIVCSGGTYVRSLARDLGEQLGCGAAVASLRRLRSEPHGLERSVTANDLRTLDRATLWAKGGIPLADALGGFPAETVAEDERAALANGRWLRRPARPAGAIRNAGGSPGAADPHADVVVLRDSNGDPLALARTTSDPDVPAAERLQPFLVFPWAVARGAA